MANTAIATEQHGAGNRAHRVARLLRMFDTVSMPVYASIATGIDEREVRPRRRDAEMDVGAEDVRRETSTAPTATSSSCVAKSATARKMLIRADSWMPMMFTSTRTRITTIADDDVPWVLAQRRPEHGEVVRDEERRHGDRRDVVEHLRPRGGEAHRLVEGVTREAGRAARLRIADRPFRVRRRGAREDEPGEDEDERRETERVDRDDAEGVVDGGADVAVRRGEERVRSEHALELVLWAPSPAHAARL